MSTIATLPLHKGLTAEKVRSWPWFTVAGSVGSELARAKSLTEHGGGPSVRNCLLRARELMGILESMPGIPLEACLALLPIARGLTLDKIEAGQVPFERFQDEIMKLYFQYNPSGRPVWTKEKS